MLLAITITVVSVVVGTLLALLPRHKDAWMGPMRTFALTSALSVVVVHLIPESLEGIGGWFILPFLAGLMLPEALGRVGSLLWAASHDPKTSGKSFALEAGYAGVLLHRVGDGVGLGVYTGELQSSLAQQGVITALAAHCVPVVAIVVLAFDSVRGRGSAVTRAVGLGLASMVGILLTQTVFAGVVQQAQDWVTAFVSGLLLHVVMHDLGVQLPKTTRQRVLDLCAAGAGILVSMAGRGAHDHEGGEAHADPLHALYDLAIETGPLLILGLAAGALLATFLHRLPRRMLQSQGPLRDALRGALVGAPLPLCSCSVLPLSASLHRSGASAALVVSFLLATPELGVETFLLSVKFLGWKFAWVRLFGALTVAIGAALVVGLIFRPKEASIAEELPLSKPPEGGVWQRFVGAFDDLLDHVGAWMILGLVAAAVLETSLGEGAFNGLSPGVQQFLVVTLVAVPSYVCAPSATPLAAVLIAKGLSPGAVLVGLLLGPATNVATLVFLRRWFGGRAAFLGVVAVIALAWGVGLLADLSLAISVPPLSEPGHHEHSVYWLALAAISGILLLRALYTRGVRGFLVSLHGEHGHSHGGLGEAAEAHSHGHAHGHSHGHSHGHGEPSGPSGRA